MKAVLATVLITIALGSENIDYNAQDKWEPDVCQSGKKQSPIDIPEMGSDSDKESTEEISGDVIQLPCKKNTHFL